MVRFKGAGEREREAKASAAVAFSRAPVLNFKAMIFQKGSCATGREINGQTSGGLPS